MDDYYEAFMKIVKCFFHVILVVAFSDNTRGSVDYFAAYDDDTEFPAYADSSYTSDRQLSDDWRNRQRTRPKTEKLQVNSHMSLLRELDSLERELHVLEKSKHILKSVRDPSKQHREKKRDGGRPGLVRVRPYPRGVRTGGRGSARKLRPYDREGFELFDDVNFFYTPYDAAYSQEQPHVEPRSEHQPDGRFGRRGAIRRIDGKKRRRQTSDGWEQQRFGTLPDVWPFDQPPVAEITETSAGPTTASDGAQDDQFTVSSTFSYDPVNFNGVEEPHLSARAEYTEPSNWGPGSAVDANPAHNSEHGNDEQVEGRNELQGSDQTTTPFTFVETPEPTPSIEELDVAEESLVILTTPTTTVATTSDAVTVATTTTTEPTASTAGAHTTTDRSENAIADILIDERLDFTVSVFPSTSSLLTPTDPEDNLTTRTVPTEPGEPELDVGIATDTSAPFSTSGACAGEWSDWRDLAQCSSDCGACGVVHRIRECLSYADGRGCPCIGEYKISQPCNIGVCQYPRPSCCPPHSLVFVEGTFACGPQSQDVMAAFLRRP